MAYCNLESYKHFFSSRLPDLDRIHFNKLPIQQKMNLINTEATQKRITQDVASYYRSLATDSTIKLSS